MDKAQVIYREQFTNFLNNSQEILENESNTCGNPKGLKIKCQYNECSFKCHIICGFFAGYYFSLEKEDEGKFRKIDLRFWCPTHQPRNRDLNFQSYIRKSLVNYHELTGYSNYEEYKETVIKMRAFSDTFIIENKETQIKEGDEGEPIKKIKMDSM